MNPHKLPRLGLALTTLAAAPASAQATPPQSVRCVLADVTGCVGEVCISNRIQAGAPVTFDFKKRRYKSEWGGGRITQTWDAPDGTHNVIVASPPAGAQLSFASDWKAATKSEGFGALKRYRCKPKKQAR